MHPDNTVIEQSIEKATWGLFRICLVKTISSFLLAYSTTYCIIPKAAVNKSRSVTQHSSELCNALRKQNGLDRQGDAIELAWLSARSVAPSWLCFLTSISDP